MSADALRAAIADEPHPVTPGRRGGPALVGHVARSRWSACGVPRAVEPDIRRLRHETTRASVGVRENPRRPNRASVVGHLDDDGPPEMRAAALSSCARPPRRDVEGEVERRARPGSLPAGTSSGARTRAAVRRASRRLAHRLRSLAGSGVSDSSPPPRIVRPSRRHPSRDRLAPWPPGAELSLARLDDCLVRRAVAERRSSTAPNGGRGRVFVQGASTRTSRGDGTGLRRPFSL